MHDEHAVGARDAGFSLIEAVLATFIVVLLFSGFGKAMHTAFSGSAGNRNAQEATAVAVTQLEFVRSLTWDEIAMTHVPTGTPMVNRETYRLVGSQANLDADEALVVDSDGLVTPMTLETVDGTGYTVWTIVSDAGSGLRRVVVLVQWSGDGADSDYRTSTLVSEVSSR